MFGPLHPRRAGEDGLQATPEGEDRALPGFGPAGTAGHHCFDEGSPAFVRIAALTALRQEYPVLRYGRQYLRKIALFDWPFAVHGPGQLVAWSRILDDQEALCVVNAHGTENRGARIVVDAALNPPGSALTVILNSAQAAGSQRFGGTHRVGSRLAVQRTEDGTTYVGVSDLPPSEVLVLTNHPEREAGGLRRP
jgi:hypothetical protein